MLATMDEVDHPKTHSVPLSTALGAMVLFCGGGVISGALHFVDASYIEYGKLKKYDKEDVKARMKGDGYKVTNGWRRVKRPDSVPFLSKPL